MGLNATSRPATSLSVTRGHAFHNIINHFHHDCLSEGLGGIERLSTAQTLTWVWRISRCLSPIEMSSGWPQWYRYRSCHGENYENYVRNQNLLWLWVH